jgi:hypothetical protein
LKTTTTALADLLFRDERNTFPPLACLVKDLESITELLVDARHPALVIDVSARKILEHVGPKVSEFSFPTREEFTKQDEIS